MTAKRKMCRAYCSKADQTATTSAHPKLATSVQGVSGAGVQVKPRQPTTRCAGSSHLFASQQSCLWYRVSPQGLGQWLIAELARHGLRPLEALALDDLWQLITAHEIASCRQDKTATRWRIQSCYTSGICSVTRPPSLRLQPVHPTPSTQVFRCHRPGRQCQPPPTGTASNPNTTCCGLVDPGEHDLTLVIGPEHHGRVRAAIVCAQRCKPQAIDLAGEQAALS